MKEFSAALLATTLTQTRKAQGLTQKDLADATGINRALISRIEQQDFMPSIPQLERLGEALDFDHASLFIRVKADAPAIAPTPRKIAVAGTGYVGLSIAILL
ncbi:helix-turn-helix domain-containing protein, partial [Eubacterium aggregans]|uniref:helix-turn-helix domain-containing protein n=1 Tax=Eubacterium aggregans TaxID=81409 RepID=UPI003F306B11